MRAILTYSLLVLLLCTALPSFADLYTYTDENGVVHVTNRPANDKKAKLVAKSAPETRQIDKNAASTGSKQRDGLPSAGLLYDPILREAAQRYSVPLALLRAVCHSESGFNPNAVSSAGAEGLMQLMPATSTRMGVTDPFDPRDNIFGGAKFLKWLIDRYGGDLVLVIAAYNAGEGSVDRAGGIPNIVETKGYLLNVLSRYYVYKNIP